MSGLARRLLAGQSAATTVTGALYGSGSLSIPAGVTSITLTGNGSGGTAAVDYYRWTSPNSISSTSNPITKPNYSGEPQGSSQASVTPVFPITTQLPSSFGFFIFGTYPCTATYSSGSTYTWVDDSSPGFGGQMIYEWKYVSTYPATAGTATTASIQSQNISFSGSASGVTTPPSPTVQTFSGLSGSASSMTYSVPAGGSLSYSYTY